MKHIQIVSLLLSVFLCFGCNTDETNPPEDVKTTIKKIEDKTIQKAVPVNASNTVLFFTDSSYITIGTGGGELASEYTSTKEEIKGSKAAHQSLDNKVIRNAIFTSDRIVLVFTDNSYFVIISTRLPYPLEVQYIADKLAQDSK